MNIEYWKNNLKRNDRLYKELIHLKGDKLKEAFDSELEFGTGGIRSKMGVGPNKLNIYTIRRISYGFGEYLIDKYKEDIYRGVVISHDNRFNSREFSIEVSKTLSSLGIKTYMFSDLRPTPFLSYITRRLNCISGIMITASHNPKEYNGYKIYDETGCQYRDEEAKKIKEYIKKAPLEFDIKVTDIKALEFIGLYKILDEHYLNDFIKEDSEVMLNNSLDKEISICYTALNGTGATVIPKALDMAGYKYSVVKEQMISDPSFKKTESPNPENKIAFSRAANYGKKHNIEILVATDPDADRCGIAVKDKKGYRYLTGNETGALLIYYLLSTLKERKELPKKGYLFDTIVTSPLGRNIAKSFKVNTYSTLTGFKYIGEQVNLLDSDEEFLFGYEESYGYLLKDNLRDKDSVQSVLLILDMANYYKVKENKTLLEKLDEIYNEYGYYIEETVNTTFDSIDGKNIMNNLISNLRENKLTSIGDEKVISIEDYLTSEEYIIKSKNTKELSLHKSNVLKYNLGSDNFVVIRPSGTEPKLKIYYSINDKDKEVAFNRFNNLKNSFSKIVKGE